MASLIVPRRALLIRRLANRMRSLKATVSIALFCGAAIAAVGRPSAAAQIVRGDHGYVGYVDSVLVIGSKKPLRAGSTANVRQSQALLVSGWATNGTKRPASAVYPIVDGHLLTGAHADMGLKRDDVAKVLGPELAASGYVVRMPVRLLPKGVHTLEMGQALVSGSIAVLHGAVTLVVR